MRSVVQRYSLIALVSTAAICCGWVSTTSAAGEVKVSAWFTVKDEKSGTLSVAAEMKDGWHIYSITQPKGSFVTRSQIKLPESTAWRLSGEFRASPPPKKKFDETLKVTYEEHSGKVVWSTPILFSSRAVVSELAISGAVFAQACQGDDVCLPPTDYRFTAKYRPSAKDDGKNEKGQTPHKVYDLLGEGGGAPVVGPPGAAAAEGQEVRVKAWFTAPLGEKPGRLFVQATMAEGWHIYSITQPPGGPTPTEIKLNDGAAIEVVGEFQPDPKPFVHFDGENFNTNVEEHAGTVTWYAPIKFAPDVDVKTLKIKGSLYAQPCTTGRCLVPDDYRFTAALDKESVQGEFRREHAVVRGHVSPRAARPGESFQINLTIQPDDGWHAYLLADKPHEDKAKNPTLIQVTGLPARWKAGDAETEATLVSKDGSLDFYEKPVTFTIPVDVPEGAQPGDYRLSGIIAFQVCDAGGCDQPTAAKFSADVVVSATGAAGETPLTLRPASYKSAEDLYMERESGGAAQSAEVPLVLALGLALLGGFILNFMPCVLPVIGLKVLSVVDKVGGDRKQIFLLNVYYTLGIVSVFLVLATLSVALNYGWGEQFQESWFNIALAAVVWTMGLSFLGVWEIPIPGFVGGGGANELQEKEGFTGSFMRGVFTTILATPCSGPMLGVVFAYTLGQPPAVVYGLFTFMGLGLAFPYLVIGVFPHLVKWLPKPGAWMETFKQAMGFVLLATVALFFSNFITSDYRPSVFALLIGLWAACWWIGRTPLTAEFHKKARAWLEAGALATAVALGLFGEPLFNKYFVYSVMPYLAGAFVLMLAAWVVVRFVPREKAGESAVARRGFGVVLAVLALTQVAFSGTYLAGDPLPWEPFSTERLEQAKAEGKTILIDFTADW